MLSLKGKLKGQPTEPLEIITLTGATDGTVCVCDSIGREYYRAKAKPSLKVTVGGSAGTHTAWAEGDDGQICDMVQFPVVVKTQINDAGGKFSKLLTILHATMLSLDESQSAIHEGKLYTYFVRWIRDHVHTLKGMKYFHASLRSGIDLYHDSQRADGMIWDNIYPYNGKSHWQARFEYGDFYHKAKDSQHEFRRIPLENDVEFLYVEGIYFTWQAIGDDAWMQNKLDSAISAMNYSVNDEYRWSKKYKLLKRAYSIDTWDFQNKEDALISCDTGDSMIVMPGRTRFGVMFGDNTGYAQSCDMLANMLDRAGRCDEANAFRKRAKDIRKRLDKLSWNGKFFTHHVSEDKKIKRDFGVDESSQVSLSNAYSINRCLSHDQCVAIIKTYQKIRSRMPKTSPGEWYTIYPPFEKGFESQGDKWQYMNGGVTPIVAGELARGAFAHGFEEYGVDILLRIKDLAITHGGHMHCAYTGAFPKPPKNKFTTLDISELANTDFRGKPTKNAAGWTGEGERNDLSNMPTGKQKLAGIAFDIPIPSQNQRRGCIGISKDAPYAQSAILPVDSKAKSIYFLHTASNLINGIGGVIKLEYADGSSFCEHVIAGKNIASWWMPNHTPAPRRAPSSAIAWQGENRITNNVGVLAYGLANPQPGKKISNIVFESSPTGGIWMVLGVTLSDKPVYFKPNPISSGIPDTWGSAAVVGALIEGLAGVSGNNTPALEHAKLSPRWASAGVNKVSSAVAYPASGGYVAYKYNHSRAKKTITLTVTGSGEKCDCHVLLPAGAKAITSVKIAKQSLAFTAEMIEKSTYANFELNDLAPAKVIINYR